MQLSPYVARTAVDVLTLDQIGADIWRAPFPQQNFAGALYGGSALGQGLRAGALSVPGDWPAHSLHALFLRAGRVDSPVDFHVTRLRDGRNFAARRIEVIQDNQVICQLMASFHNLEQGENRQFEMPQAVPNPEDCPSLPDFIRDHPHRFPPEISQIYGQEMGFDLRLIDAEKHLFANGGDARRAYWLRMSSASAVPDGTAHQALLAFLSDVWLIGVAVDPLVLSTARTRTLINSLDHAMWFHRPVRTDEWLLNWTDGPSAQDGRGLGRSLIFDLSGRLVASAAQEGLFRSQV